MKNVIASFIIFLILIICILFSINYLEKTCSHYKNITSSLENTIKDGSWEESYEISIKLLKNWEKDSKVISIFIDHEYIDDMHVELLKLTQYVKYKNKSDSLASLHSIKFLIDDIIDFEKTTIQNIL
ncbi:DUF4363 family protein [Clostridium ganghwense]|uniref:DUF4363 family protein n=1 Tax=Clostridium ganghwense TaxID=312089 RepID=A0ABT4CKJ1_9CLOT|nr:DUF4363 family protein [Clostridium ganghwense]MCY6369557.1 DUF4363 family protein [Clostridium ganghwense]